MWWKCDLQVATPAWPGFRFPAGQSATTDDGRRQFALRYVRTAKAAGIQVLALADHHTCSWLEPIRAAAEEVGDIVVFPGVEVTTGSGSDGVHLVLVGGLDKDEQAIERILDVACGFNDDHPRYQPGSSEPAPARHTLTDILDKLPADWLVIAPHALNENGIASQKTLQGGMRWKALHHDRLSAIDVGSAGREENSSSFNARFRRRELSHFPCLEHIAFVSTSDAYELGELGQRFTWIRMEEPSIEGLRQAFLDHEARVLCDWDPRLSSFRDRNPNHVGHSWISSVSMVGLSNARGQSVSVEFDPRLNVLIGGRGSGKSTIVAALRQLYSSVNDLPEGMRSEASSFVQNVLADCEISAEHRLAISQEEQRATWTSSAGSTTHRRATETTTEFPVRVVSQKELYERVAGDSSDPSIASRHLLSMVDEGVLHAAAADEALTFEEAVRSARARWVSAFEAFNTAHAEVGQLTSTKARIAELEAQVGAYDSDTAKLRRQRNEQQISELAQLNDGLTTFGELVDETKAVVERQPDNELPGTTSITYIQVSSEISTARASFVAAVHTAANSALASLAEIRQQLDVGPAAIAAAAALADMQTLRDELRQLGLDPSSYDSVRSDLDQERRQLSRIEHTLAELTSLDHQVVEAWQGLEDLYTARLDKRRLLLDEVCDRSGSLRFRIDPHADAGGWARTVRGLLSLRADGFVDDVPILAGWLCDPTISDGDRRTRYATWRDALATNRFESLDIAGVRSAWWTRLSTVDSSIRLRVAAELPDDLVTMSFLRESGNPANDTDWQRVSQGSPGQRSAAMLSFVLHHGNEPLVLDQPEDDLDSAWISALIVRELRRSRWTRQVIVATHNANIPVIGDSERVIVMENRDGVISVRGTERGRPHLGAIENQSVRSAIQEVMEGGVRAFVRRERKYNNELSTYRAALRGADPRDVDPDQLPGS